MSHNARFQLQLICCVADPAVAGPLCAVAGGAGRRPGSHPAAAALHL